MAAAFATEGLLNDDNSDVDSIETDSTSSVLSSSLSPVKSTPTGVTMVFPTSARPNYTAAAPGMASTHASMAQQQYWPGWHNTMPSPSPTVYPPFGYGYPSFPSPLPNRNALLHAAMPSTVVPSPLPSPPRLPPQKRVITSEQKQQLERIIHVLSAEIQRRLEQRNSHHSADNS